MHIEFRDMDNITIRPSDEELELSPEELFIEVSNAAVGIVWKIADFITVDVRDLADNVRNFSDSLHRLIGITVSKFEEEQKANERKAGREEKLYTAMERWFDDFIVSNHYVEKEIISIASNMKNPKLSTTICDGKCFFDICSDDKKTIHIGAVNINAVKQTIKTECIKSSAIAVVLFDKVFDDEEKHPMRGRNGQMFFEIDV